MPQQLNPSQEVSNYIETLPEWSKAICRQLRKIILESDASIKEEWKWGPHYSSNGMVCGFSAFQKHAKLTFYNGAAMKDPKGLFNHCVDNEFSRSIKFTSESDIDSSALAAYVKESVAVNKKGFKREVKDKTVEVPEDLQQALSNNKTAERFFNDLTYGYKKEYVEYVNSAKREQTRTERLHKVVNLCAASRKLNDKYKS